MDIDWKRPFEVAFELGMAAIGWALVLIIVCLIFMVSYAAIYAVIKTIKKDKNKTLREKAAAQRTLFKIVKGKNNG